MEQRVGTCSLCGGPVFGYRGVWGSIDPPPPDRCWSCGAVSASDVIPMVRPTHPSTVYPKTATGTGTADL